MSVSPTPAELTAIRTGYAALAASNSPTSNVVETIVFALGAAKLLTEPNAEVPAAVFRAEYDSIHLGHYTNPEAAQAHCESYARRELGAAAADTFDWVHAEDTPEDPHELYADVFGEVGVTGYVVRPLTVSNTFDVEVNE